MSDPGSNPSSIAGRRKSRSIFTTMSTKSRQTIYGGSIIGAKIRAEAPREAAQKAIREADRAEAEAWSIQMEGYGGPAQPLPHHRTMPQRWVWMARSRMHALQDPRKRPA